MWDNQDLFRIGLCDWVDDLWREDKITEDERYDLSRFIQANRPSKFSSIDAYKHRSSSYYWPKYDIKPRLKWIKKHYNKLDKNDTPL